MTDFVPIAGRFVVGKLSRQKPARNQPCERLPLIGSEFWNSVLDISDFHLCFFFFSLSFLLF